MGVEFRAFLIAGSRGPAPDAGRIATLIERLRSERWVTTSGHPALRSGLSDPSKLPDHESTGGWARLRGDRPRAPMRAAIPEPASASWLAERYDPRASDPQSAELSLVFNVYPGDTEYSSFEEAGLAYPFTKEDDGVGYHEIFVHASRDFVHHSSENVDPLDTRCACFAELGYEASVAPIREPARIHVVCPACGAAFDPRRTTADMRNGYDGQPLPALPGGGAYRFALIIDCSKGWPRTGGAPRVAPALRELFESIIEEGSLEISDFY